MIALSYWIVSRRSAGLSIAPPGASGDRPRYPNMATPISINIPHQLGVEEAKRRIERGFGDLQSQIAAVRIATLAKAFDVTTETARR